MKCSINFCNIPVVGSNQYCFKHGFLNEKTEKKPGIRKVSEKRSVSELKELLKSGSTISKAKKTGVNDKKLWKVFSEYIRLRDADKDGICKCFTCNHRAHWKKMDCGHGIGRQHWGTRYNEKNNHSQCKKCNGFEGGMREVYRENMDKKYGPGTWDLMNLAKRGKQPSQFEIDQMEKHYKKRVAELKKVKA